MLRAIEFRVETKEGNFTTERRAYVFFEHTKDPQAEIKDVLDEIETILLKGLKGWGRPQVNLYGTSPNYNTVDGYRYICEYPGETCFRKWDESTRAYEEVRKEIYEKMEKGYKRPNISKQVKTIRKQMEADILEFVLKHGRVDYKPYTSEVNSEN